MPTNPKLILWDLDGTLCLHNEAFFKLAPKAVARAALDFHIPLSVSEAEEMGQQNFTGQRGCVRAFAARFALDEDELFARYYEHLSSEFLSTDPTLIAAFQNTPAQIMHGVLTQAPASWAVRALTQLGLLDFFQKDFIWGREALEGHHKADSKGQQSVQRKLQAHSLAAHDVALVDDKLAVLEAMRPCAATLIWIHPETESPPQGIACAASARTALSLLV